MLTASQFNSQAITSTPTSTLTSKDILARIKSYQLLPQLQRELIIDQAIASIHCTSDELEQAQQQWRTQSKSGSDEAQQFFRNYRSLTAEDITALLSRLLRIEKFKQQMWNHKLESYFLQRKQSLDQAIYSIIRLQDEELAPELYFRIQDDPRCFPQLAREYSQGGEAYVGGIVGPVELGMIHPELATLLAISQSGQLWQPLPIDSWILIVRLETLIPARLTAPMRQRLLAELFETWVQEQLNQADKWPEQTLFGEHENYGDANI